MFINEVENIVGLTKKSIRYYETLGFLNPERSTGNGYRIYNENDIYKLKVIKFLRELDVPIRDLKLLNEGSLNLKECLNERIKKIKEYQKNYDKVKKMCEEIINDNAEYNNLNIDEYFKEISILNKKERFTMNSNMSSKGKRIFGAVFSSLLFSSLFLFLIGIISYFQITENEKIPYVIYWFLMLILALPIMGMIYNLVLRIKEIVGGEEDEASKY